MTHPSLPTRTERRRASRSGSAGTGAIFAGRLARNATLAATTLFFALPVVWLLSATMKTPEQIRNAPPLSSGNPSTLVHAWQNLLSYQDGMIVGWIWNSIGYSLGSVALSVLTAVPAGFALAKFPFRGNKVLLFTTLVAMLVPNAAITLPLYLEMSSFGLTNTAWSVILPLACYPFGVYLVYLYSVATIPDSLIEAARIDGCNGLQVFSRIFLPLGGPAIGLVVFFSFVNSWNNFFLPYIMLSSQEKATLQTGINQLASSTNALTGAGNFNNLPIHETEIAVAAVVSILPILIIFLFAQRYLVAGQVAGAEKG